MGLFGGREGAGGGGMFANLSAAAALLFSGYSFYETVWRAEDLRLFVSPLIQYADPYNGPFDVYGVPVTIANTGARAGVILSFDLEVANPRSGETKRYYSADFGAWKEAYNREAEPFAPITVPGREAITRQILFYPRNGEEVDRLVETDPGTYQFKLTLNAAPVERLPEALGGGAASAETIAFEMEIDGVDYRAFNEGGTISLRRPDYAPVVSD